VLKIPAFAKLQTVMFNTIKPKLMTDIKEIISDISHRPFPIPKGQWTYYQEWNKALFLYWTVPFEALRKYVPENLNIDTYNNQSYVSLVAFIMEKIRPRFLPSIHFISNFAEINIRTYIDNNGIKGVYFLNIEADNFLSTFVARQLSGLPYEKANIKKTDNQFISKNFKKNISLDTEFDAQSCIETKTELDKWLIERYCLYLDKGNELYRYDIHHKEWQIKSVKLKRLNLKYQIGDIKFTEQPNLTHYSDGVKVIAWDRQNL